MRITERKYLDAYIQAIGNEIPSLIQNYDFSEDNGKFDYLTKSSAVSYLDIVRELKEIHDLPLAAYNMSGEYAMIKAAA